MPILLTKLRTVVYRASVVANARYRAATRKRHVKDILEIVSDSAMHDAKEAGPVADILLRRDQAV
jgi:hypothetical protein